MKTDKLQGKVNIRSITLCAVFTALLCIAAPISIPLGSVPITLATFAVYTVGAVLPLKQAILSVALYIFMGAFGLPVFAGYAGGLHVLSGPTGGYIVGYIACVFAEGLILKLKSDKPYMYALAMICGTALLYALGTVWYCLVANASPLTAIPVCVLPFLPLDAVKIIAASVLSFALNSRLRPQQNK